MYQAEKERYKSMEYCRCGNSGLKLPAVSFGLWHNFGDDSDYENMKQLCITDQSMGVQRFILEKF